MITPEPNKPLRTAIYVAGLNQRVFAFLMGVSETLVSNIVNGFKKPTNEFRQKASVLLEREVRELFPEGNGSGRGDEIQSRWEKWQ